ncbi:MAG: homoserine kinase [Gammaproteobacteria bacterium]|nr:homoserine kinase [Gammaproteobacteria bacterium]
MDRLTVFAPASIGNFIVGFDILGAAIETHDRCLGDTLTISNELPAGYQAVGEFAFRLPKDKDNLVIKTAEVFNQKIKELRSDIKVEKLNFQLSKNLPIGSGLGSSSSSIVATMVGLNSWYKEPFQKKDILKWCAQIEGGNSGAIHYDNVTPCLFGGLQLINPELATPYQSIPFFDDLHLAIIFPDIEITTKSAREVLPKNLSLKQAVEMQQRLASFIAACYRNEHQVMLDCLKDHIIEPTRKVLIPKFDEGKKTALENGALTFAISGSGPTCFALCNTEAQARKVAAAVYNVMEQGNHAFYCVGKIGNKGSRKISNEDF